MRSLADEVKDIIAINTRNGSGFGIIHDSPEVKRFKIMSGLRLTFWSGEIVISGDSFASARNGIVSDNGYNLEWFVNQTGETDYLCSKFLMTAYCPYRAVRRFMEAMEEPDNGLTEEQRKALREFAALDEDYQFERVQDASSYVEFVEELDAWHHFMDDGPPYHYPRNAAAWLIAIQRVFAKAYNEHIEGKAA